MSEPTAILNAYEFLKNVLFRIFSQRFKREPEIMEMINAFKISPGEAPTVESLARAVGAVNKEAETSLRQVCRRFRPGLVINMSRGEDMNLGQSLHDICHKFLDLDVDFLGVVPEDRQVQECFLRMKPITLEFPDSSPSKALRDIAHKCMTGRWREHSATLADTIQDPDPSATLAGDEARETPATKKLNSLMDGRRDTELSDLLSQFLSAYSADKGRPSPTRIEPPGQLSPWDFHQFEPRLDSRHTLPQFKPAPGKQDTDEKASFFSFIQKRREAFRSILDIPEADNIPLALDLALSQAPPPDRDQGMAWLSTGTKLVEYNQFTSANRALARALECLPGDPVAANNYAAGLLAIGRIKQALDVLTEGHRRDTKDTALVFNAGLARFLSGKYLEARDFFRYILERKDKNPSAATLLAHCEYRLQHFEEAIALLSSVVAQDARDSTSHFNIGVCRLMEKKFDEAASSFTAFLFYEPEDAEALAARGMAHWCAKRLDDALRDLSSAIQKQPSNLAFRGLRGTLSYISGRYDKAIEDIEIITRLLPENQKYQSLLAEIRRRLIRS
ncbi:MAG: tetratricopeptide repeat protein [Lentisphaerota bacterium]